MGLSLVSWVHGGRPAKHDVCRHALGCTPRHLQAGWSPACLLTQRDLLLWACLQMQSDMQRDQSPSPTLPPSDCLPSLFRDLKNGFVDALEGLIERHIPGYCRAERQHSAALWAPRLQAGGLFRLAESFQLSNPLALKNLATLSDILNSQSYVRGTLTGV